jgi:hypothetical protein
MTKARSNATANAAKGDLTVGNGTNLSGVLGVGSNGDTIVADSSTATGLAYIPTFFAGKNRIINGDFAVNQRQFSSSTSSGYTFDRWLATPSGGTVTYSAQTFTPGAAPVTGYEGKNFIQIATTGQSGASDFTLYDSPMEDVRTFANQTATISFWAKAASGTPKVAVEFNQNFGSGGTPSAEGVTYAGNVTLSTSWVRYSLTVAIPSISGKTLGTTNSVGFLNLRFWTSGGSTWNSRTGSIGLQNSTISLWGVQLEAGSTATAFQTATGTIQGELAACQRYYYRQGGASAYQTMATGWGNAASIQVKTIFPVTMRTTPTTLDSSTLIFFDQSNAGITVTGLSIVATQSSNQLGYLTVSSVSGQTQYRNYDLAANNSTSAFLGFGAEL